MSVKYAEYAEYPHQVLISLYPPPSAWEKYDWCVETFGEIFTTWTYGDSCFCFKHEKDAMLFVLRWS